MKDGDMEKYPLRANEVSVSLDNGLLIHRKRSPFPDKGRLLCKIALDRAGGASHRPKSKITNITPFKQVILSGAARYW